MISGSHCSRASEPSPGTRARASPEPTPSHACPLPTRTPSHPCHPLPLVARPSPLPTPDSSGWTMNRVAGAGVDAATGTEWARPPRHDTRKTRASATRRRAKRARVGGVVSRGPWAEPQSRGGHCAGRRKRGSAETKNARWTRKKGEANRRAMAIG